MRNTAHYFTDNRNLEENRKDHSFRFSGTLFTFTTDNGVFSKSEVDQGTEILLKAVCKEPLSGRVLDLGCGYGPVGIIVKKLYPECDVTSVDINPRAVELAQINCEKNEVSVNVHVSDGFDDVSGTFDHVITNPPIRTGKKVIYKMFEDAQEKLNDHGDLTAVIRRKQGAESAVKKFQEIFGNCEVISRDKGYWVIRSYKIDG